MVNLGFKLPTPGFAVRRATDCLMAPGYTQFVLSKWLSIYPKYWDTLTPYHTCPKICASSLYNRLIRLKTAGEWQTVRGRSAVSDVALLCLFQPIYEALPGILGNRGIRSFISGEQGNKSLKLKGTGEQRQFGGTGNIENQDFDLGEQGKMLIFSGEQGNRYPPPSPPHPTPPTTWEGLIYPNA